MGHLLGLNLARKGRLATYVHLLILQPFLPRLLPNSPKRSVLRGTLASLPAGKMMSGNGTH
jgi:hypothetical protein